MVTSVLAGASHMVKSKVTVWRNHSLHDKFMAWETREIENLGQSFNFPQILHTLAYVHILAYGLTTDLTSFIAFVENQKLFIQSSPK